MKKLHGTEQWADGEGVYRATSSQLNISMNIQAYVYFISETKINNFAKKINEQQISVTIYCCF